MAKTNMKLRVGFVGCGRVTQGLHLPVFRRLADWQVIAAADSNEHCLSSTANRFGIPHRYAGYQSLLVDPDVDVVAVCVPPRLHAKVAMAALEAGKHVFIEKPLAVSLEECDQLIELSARSPQKVMVGFNLRWHRLIRKTREIIQSGALGELELIRTTFTTGGALQTDTPDWSSWRAPGGGVLFDLGVHHFDLLRYVTGGEVQEISAMNHSSDAGGQSSAVTLRMDNGLLVNSVFSNQITDSNELEISGRKGAIRVSIYRFDGFEFITAPGSFGGLQRLPSKLSTMLKEIPGALARASRGGDFHATYEGEWQAFANSIRDNKPVECSLEDGRRAVEVSLAALASESQSRPIQITASRHDDVRTPVHLASGSEPLQDSYRQDGGLIGAALPALSVILATPDCYETIRKTVKCLRAQSVSKQMELIIVAPSSATLNLVEDDLKVFHSYRVVKAGPIRSLGSANALGVRHASAPVVALTEDHSFPQPGWAEALIATHRNPWSAVGPVVRNANPKTRFSRADMLIGYGPWIDPAPAGFVAFLPGHNCSYKRDVLLEYGSGLVKMMEAETVLHWDLRAKGHKLYLEPAAKLAHINFEDPAQFVAAHFYGGRAFATSRAQDGHWTWPRKLLFACASPLIPLVRLWRTLRNISRPGRPWPSAFLVLPHLLLGLTADGAGQMLGYLIGSNSETSAKLMKLEFHRNREREQAAARKRKRGPVHNVSTGQP